jgi:hypothetical protein
MEKSALLILAGGDCHNAMTAALLHAQNHSGQLRVIQILNSDLYHYGHHDLVATRPSKRQFLLYERDLVLERGQGDRCLLEEAGRVAKVTLDIDTIESEDIHSACLSEVKKGYNPVFVPKQKPKLFPLFEKTLAEYLRKRTESNVIAC